VLRHLGFRSEQIDAVVDEGQRKRVDATIKAGNDPDRVIVVDKTPVYKKWWFWVAIGGAVVAAGAITAGIVVGTRGDAASPDRVAPANTLMFAF
jgi:hypothetical protein